jgi:hypothetical protein
MNILNYLLQTNLYLILFMGFYTLVSEERDFLQTEPYLPEYEYTPFIYHSIHQFQLVSGAFYYSKT